MCRRAVECLSSERLECHQCSRSYPALSRDPRTPVTQCYVLCNMSPFINHDNGCQTFLCPNAYADYPDGQVLLDMGAHGEGRQSDESELLAMEEQTPVKEDEYNDMEDYLIFVTDTQATLLKGSEGQGLHQEVRQTTGADVQLFPRLPSARDTNTVIVRGSRLQIQKAVRLIYQKTEAQVLYKI
ncbi:hypothetical protein C0Q70_09095 [Pomacea canaliculata]|uniref:K Homology domain-containing protein n=1 Tax=Pomacea canaliculata TaxID=400727 RepID=A0A2T7P8U5_POMCA|nr:hypothetical protein C0Q70_09095 [Pomacea canaliculata]